MKNPVSFLRCIALIEAVSFLVLLFVAMPLKYFAGLPSAVKAVGWVHGILFMILCWALLQAIIAARWPLSRAALIFVAALLPFGPFLADRRMRAYEAQYRDQSARDPAA